ATATPAGDKKIAGVDVAFGDDCVHATVEVIEIVAGIGMMNQIGEFFAVTGAAAGVGVQDNVSARGKELLFEIKTVAIIRKWAAVNLDDQRIFLGRIKVGRLNDPALNFALVF